MVTEKSVNASVFLKFLRRLLQGRRRKIFLIVDAHPTGERDFAIDDPEALKQEARVLALANAKEKAEALSKVVGVKLRRVVSFNESFGQVPPPIFYDKIAFGRAEESAAMPAPSIEPGSSEIVVNAYVTYEIE